ncbi:hypothetical protein LRP88_09433 [Fusarium phalaenopsidis]
MVLPYDLNNPYGPEDIPNRLMPLASVTDVGVEPELQRFSLDTNQPNRQRDVTKSANMVENHADIAQSGVFLEEDYDNLKYIRHDSDEEKWKEAWGRLFPDLPTPSPFYESDFEIISRTGRPACIKALRKASQGHGDLSALADELLSDLTHTLVPAARGSDIDTTATEVSQAADPAHSLRVTRRTTQFRDLPEANPLMVPPQVPPDTPLPSQEQTFAQPQQIPPDLSGVEEFSTEALQSWLLMQNSHSMALQFPQHMLNASDVSLSQSSSATPTNLHNNVYNDRTSFLSDEEMILGMAFSAEMRERRIDHREGRLSPLI